MENNFNQNIWNNELGNNNYNIEKNAGLKVINEENQNNNIELVNINEKDNLNYIEPLNQNKMNLINQNEMNLKGQMNPINQNQMQNSIHQNQMQNPMNQNPMNQNQMNQNPMNQNQMNQNQMNQNPMNQNQMNQNPMNQNPMNQNQMNQNQMNQNPMNQNQMNQNQMNQNQMYQNQTNQNQMYQNQMDLLSQSKCNQTNLMNVKPGIMSLINPQSKISMSNVFDKLDSLYIKQHKDFNLFLRKKFYIYSTKFNSKGKKEKRGKKLFKIKENSSTCDRLCVNKECRPMKINIYNYLNYSKFGDNSLCLVIEKEYTCTISCFNLPKYVIKHVEGGNEYILGTIVNTFNCCAYEFNILDKYNNPRFKLIMEYLQCGVYCKSYPCRDCNEADLDIFDYNTNEKIEIFKKKARNFTQRCIFQGTNYLLNYSNNYSWENKSLLMCASIFADYLAFKQ